MAQWQQQIETAAADTVRPHALLPLVRELAVAGAAAVEAVHSMHLISLQRVTATEVVVALWDATHALRLHWPERARAFQPL